MHVQLHNYKKCTYCVFLPFSRRLNVNSTRACMIWRTGWSSLTALTDLCRTTYNFWKTLMPMSSGIHQWPWPVLLFVQTSIDSPGNIYSLWNQRNHWNLICITIVKEFPSLIDIIYKCKNTFICRFLCLI